MAETPRQVVVVPRFEDTKSADFRYVFATGVFGGLDPNGGRLLFYLDRLEPVTTNEPPTPGAQKLAKVVRELQIEVHVSPAQFKSIAAWMASHLKTFEDTFGEIAVEPKKVQPKATSSKIVT